MDQRADLAIIGGGSTAISFLAQFIDLIQTQSGNSNLHIIVFEPSPTIGPGGPYGSDLSSNLLNIPAGKMSAYAQHRDHFLAWMQRQSDVLLQNYDVKKINADDFVARPLFGLYLQDVWQKTLLKATKMGITLRHVQDTICRITRSPIDGPQLHTPQGSLHWASRVVLCNGNLPSIAFPHLEKHPNYFNSPYPVRTLVDTIPKNSKVGIIGTSLSAIDAIVALKQQGHTGEIIATSRNGRLPSVRSQLGIPRQVEPLNIEQFLALSKDNNGSLTLSDVLTVLTSSLAKTGTTYNMSEMMGADLHPHAALEHEISVSLNSPRLWQNVAISLNDVIEQVWHLLALPERERFYSEWRSLWMTRRATFPLANAMRLQQYISTQSLQILPKFHRCFDTEKGLMIQLSGANNTPHCHYVDYLINATSFSLDITQTKDPLMNSLLQQGLVCPDPYGGLRLDFDTGCLINSSDERIAEISVLGSLATGTYFWTVSLDVNARLALKQAERLAVELSQKTESHHCM